MGREGGVVREGDLLLVERVVEVDGRKRVVRDCRRVLSKEGTVAGRREAA